MHLGNFFVMANMDVYRCDFSANLYETRTKLVSSGVEARISIFDLCDTRYSRLKVTTLKLRRKLLRPPYCLYFQVILWCIVYSSMCSKSFSVQPRFNSNDSIDFYEILNAARTKDMPSRDEVQILKFVPILKVKTLL